MAVANHPIQVSMREMPQEWSAI